MQRPTTIKQVIAYLAANGVTTELTRGKGYFYFWGDKEAQWHTSSVSVARLNHLTLEGWLAAYRSLEADNNDRQ